VKRFLCALAVGGSGRGGVDVARFVEVLPRNVGSEVTAATIGTTLLMLLVRMSSGLRSDRAVGHLSHGSGVGKMLM